MNRFFPIGLPLVGAALLSFAVTAPAQKVLSPKQERAIREAILKKMAVRVRVTRADPQLPAYQLRWNEGGQGLGGLVVRGDFQTTDGKLEIPFNTWSDWQTLLPIVGPGDVNWCFVTVAVLTPGSPAQFRVKAVKPKAVLEAVVEFEFTDGARIFKRFTEAAPTGATVSFAYPGKYLTARGSAEPEFVAHLQGLSTHAHDRRLLLEKLFPAGDSVPKQFAITSTLHGYGTYEEEDDTTGKGLAAGYGVRHSSPAILKDEAASMRLLGINGMVGTRGLDAAGIANRHSDFQRAVRTQGGMPMNYFRSRKEEIDGCPFDPDMKDYALTLARTDRAIHEQTGAEESWSEWGSEMGIQVRDHILRCPTCREQFQVYLRSLGNKSTDFGQTLWSAVEPYPLWRTVKTPEGEDRLEMVPGPAGRPEALRYYYTHRFLTYATAQLFTEGAEVYRKAGIPMFTMFQPTPSWAGSELDWHEFYDWGANTAVVWETSNRDPRVWQLESYLADIARGVARQHDMEIGSLIKPHRGAPEQRMLAIVSRGAHYFEWYTYGPDYAKGDGFSHNPLHLERVGRAVRFLARAEDHLYKAKWAGQPEVALVLPRSAELWERSQDKVTALEDAKWVYLALRHAHIPVDILSEQQLADERLKDYKVAYVVGPNLRRDAAERLAEWVKAGGVLWTDAGGLARDEANQPQTALAELFGTGARRVEKWGEVPRYGATDLHPFVENAVPPGAAFSWATNSGVWGKGRGRAFVGREPLALPAGEVLVRFADAKPAVVRRRVGQGQVIVVGLYAGLTYSGLVRQPVYSMAKNYDPALRALITAAALEQSVYRPVVLSEPLVEPIVLEKDGRRSIALINWSYDANPNPKATPSRFLNEAHKLRVALRNVGEFKAVRSLRYGNLTVIEENGERRVTVPQLDEIDLLILE